MASIESRLHEAAMEGNVAILQELLCQEPLLLDMAILNSRTPLHIAALLGHSTFASYILRLRPQLAHQLDSRGFSPLHFAAAKGHLEIIRELLQIDHNLCLLRDADGRNPLHLAAMNGCVHVLEELIKSAPEAAQTAIDHGGSTILHLCVKNHRLESLKVFVKAMDDDVSFLNATDDYGFTILHLAVSNKNIEAVEFLLKIRGVEVNVVNSNGFTPLDVLIQSNRDVKDLEIAELLRAAGARRSTASPRNQNSTTLPSPPSDDVQPEHWLSSEKDALMVVASVTTTMAFAAGINPPSGVWQEDLGNQVAGKSILATKNPKRYSDFIAYITVSFVLCLVNLFLLTTGYLSKRSVFRLVPYFIMGGSISLIGIGYWYSIIALTPENTVSELRSLLWFQLSMNCALIGLVMLFMARKVVVSKARNLISRFRHGPR